MSVPRKEGAQGLMRRVEDLRAEVAGADPRALAARAGAAYRATGEGEGAILIPVWGRGIEIAVPGFVARDGSTGREADPGTQAVLAYHLRTTDGSPPEGRWISFSDLPEGTFYLRAFQGYTGDAIARAFGADPESLPPAAEKLGGRRAAEGDISYSFLPLPRVPILLVFWRGDEEFPPSARILFDATAGRHLPTDVCAVLGGTLARRLVRAR